MGAGSQMTRKRLTAPARRDLVLTAAARCFAAGGYEATTIERIASDAGVTKPIVYRHFESKKELYLTLLRRHRDDLPSFFDGIDIALDESLEGSLRIVLERWFAYIARNSHAWEMLFRDAGGDAEIQGFRLEVSARAREVIASFMVESGSRLPTAQVVPTAELLTRGLAQLALWSIDHPEVERDDLIAVALRMSAPAFGPPGVDMGPSR